MATILRGEMVGLAILTCVMTILLVNGQMTSGAPLVQAPDGCSVSLKGQLVSTNMVPEGKWTITSSECQVTGRSQGIASGAFTGSFSSGTVSGQVTGKWNVAGGSDSVVAANTQFTVSVTVGSAPGNAPMLDSPLQGMVSGAGVQSMFVVDSTSQITQG